MLSLVEVNKGYWRGSVRVDVLRDVSLELNPGAFAAVWGPLKAGKTTLLTIAAGLDAPDTGEVRFDGRSVGAMSRRELQRVRRQEIGFARPTGPLEHELSVLDYVALPLIGTVRRRDAQRRAIGALRVVGLESDSAGLGWSELTNGERTLVSLAHAVVREPRLLLVDDPTSSLGVHERERTIALLHRFAVESGMAVLMTAPDVPATLGAHEVLTLTSGTLQAVATADDGSLVRLPGA